MKRSETTEQIKLFNWANNNLTALPCLALMYHVPNEGKRSNGAVLKAMGMKNGVPDVVLPVASHNIHGDFHGLYLEMKYGKNKATKEQKVFMELLEQQGYKTAVCYSFEEAKEEILRYLQNPQSLSLEKCLSAAWIFGKCDGVKLPNLMFSHTQCRCCKRHNATQAETILADNMAAVPRRIREMIETAIVKLSAGVPIINSNMEDTLENINKELTLLTKEEILTTEQSAVVLNIAMEAYEVAKLAEKRRLKNE